MASMSHAALVTTDLIAITVLVFGLYFPRYRRRDMVVAILGLGILMVAASWLLHPTRANSQPGHQPVGSSPRVSRRRRGAGSGRNTDPGNTPVASTTFSSRRVID